jgi:YD repeat-containing protein
MNRLSKLMGLACTAVLVAGSVPLGLSLAQADGPGDPAAGQIGRDGSFVFDDSGFGFSPASAVNVVNGNLLLAASMFDVPHSNDLLGVTAVYNSLSQERRDLGVGWRQTTGYDVRLEALAGGDYAFFGPTGYREVFSTDGSGGYTPADPGFGSLMATSGGMSVATAAGDAYLFDGSGQLTSYQDAEGGALSFDYTSAGGQTRLSAVHDPGGTITHLSYNGDGSIIEADDPASQHYYFGYDSGQHLTSISGPSSSVTFTYYASGLLHTASSSGGELLTVVYTAEGKVASLTDSGSSGSRSVSYTYQAADPSDCDDASSTGETITSDSGDPDGSPVVYCYDAAGHVTTPTEPN